MKCYVLQEDNVAINIFKRDVELFYHRLEDSINKLEVPVLTILQWAKEILAGDEKKKEAIKNYSSKIEQTILDLLRDVESNKEWFETAFVKLTKEFQKS